MENFLFYTAAAARLRTSSQALGVALMILLGVLVVLVLMCVFVTACKPFAPRRRRRSAVGPGVALFLYAVTVIALGVCLYSLRIYLDSRYSSETPPVVQTDPIPTDSTPQLTEETEASTGTDTQPSTEEETEAPTEDPRLSFSPEKTEASDPEAFGIQWEIMVNDEIVESYTREEPISFSLDTEYFALPGVATFRGNNYRDDPTYGTAAITKESLSTVWKHNIGSYNEWGGCAWTGQPLVVQWDEETKAIMNLYDSKKEKEDLVEVIYATLDGNIHFYDLEDGTKTRDPIFMGMNFKGAGALDPRGYPLLYVGGGLNVGSKHPRMYVVSLIDGSILYQYGDADPFALRDWTAFDSSPLVDAETDTLIWPGESGVLYTIKLNTQYDKEAGTLSVDPDTPVKARYTSTYSESGRYLGYETSAVIVDHYMFLSENGGLFQCIDLNTMELCWAQDTKDDSNSSPLFQWGENGEGYIYTAPSLHWTAEGHDGAISIYKLDAATGEILWTYEKECVRYDDIAGGVQSSPVLGREGTSIEGMIIYTIGRTPTAYKGVVTALDTQTGEVIWEVSSGNYAWSSPVPLYTESGKAYLFFVNASGYCQLLDGETGKTVATLSLGATTEASPVVFNNSIVIGTREHVWCIKVS